MADKTPNEKLTSRQEKAIIALLNEPGVRKAAIAADVPERTLYSWLKLSSFQEAYAEARREAMRQATARLQQGSVAAVNVLLMMMARDATPAALRLSAAKTILELSYRASELDDLDQRLRALEERNGK
jgi:hypothetical protein